MKKEDLGALKNLYEGIFSENPSQKPCDNPTVSRTITEGLGIYQSKIMSSSPKEDKPKNITEEAETVRQIVSATPSTLPLKNTSSLLSNTSWGTKATIKDVSELYGSIYEEKKKDQDEDGDNDFDDVRIARLIASGMSKEEAMRKVKEDPKGDEVKEELEQVDEATRMRKELGKEGETATRKELAARSKAHKRSGSVDKTIAAAERAADWSGDEKKAKALRGLASSRRKSVRDKPRAGMSGYAAKVEGGDKDLQTARQKAMSAGTLTPKEKKQLGEDLHKYQQGYTGIPEETIMSEDYQLYEVVSTYLLENNFAEDVDSANAIIENMSPVWVEQVIEEYNEYVDDYNLFIEEMEEVGVDLDEWSDEELEEAYKKLPFRKMVKQAKKTGKSLEDVMKVARDHEPSRAKGRAHANKLAGAITGGRKADRKPEKGDKSKDEPGGYGDLSKYTGDIYAKKFKPGKTVPKVMKFGRPFGKYQPRNIKFGDIKKMGLD